MMVGSDARYYIDIVNFFWCVLIQLSYVYLHTEVAEDDYKIACLMMVFVAVALPRLARSDFAVFKASLEGVELDLMIRSFQTYPTLSG